MATPESSNTWVCPNCNTSHPRYREESISFGCRKCGQSSTIQEDGSLKLWPDSKRFKAVSTSYLKYLKPGDHLQYKKEDFVVTGVMTFHVHWKEWDREDGTWEKGTSKGVEWYAEGNKDNTLRIERDDGHFFIRELIDAADIKESVKKDLAYSDRIKHVEYGHFRLDGFIGEDDEPLNGERMDYRTTDDKQGYVYAEFKEGQFEETVIYNRLKSLSYVRLRRMKVPSKASILEARARVNRLRFFRMLALVGLILLPMLLALQNWELKPIDFQSRKAVFTRPTAGNDGSLLEPKLLGKAQLREGGIYCMEVYCGISSTNNFRNFNIDVIRGSTGEILASISSSFYRESGVDSDGHWTENKLKGELKFRVDETDQYVFFARQSGSEGTDTSATLQVSIHSFVPYRYYLVAFLGLLIATLVIQFRFEQALLDGNLEGGTPMMRLKG